MNKLALFTSQAPAAIGPYSQAVQAGPFLYPSGQIALDPGTGRLVEGDVTFQTRRVMENLRAVLRVANLTFADVVKATIFVQDMDEFGVINQVYGEYLMTDPPARSTVQVARLPLDATVEIELVAYKEEDQGERNWI
jgi:2-iminobutanoate/2-iminopropanoate deaminase